MADNKKGYWKGYANGQRDANRVKSVAEIIHQAVVPGTLPTEKGDAYRAGYDAGKRDGKKK